MLTLVSHSKLHLHPDIKGWRRKSRKCIALLASIGPSVCCSEMHLTSFRRPRTALKLPESALIKPSECTHQPGHCVIVRLSFLSPHILASSYLVEGSGHLMMGTLRLHPFMSNLSSTCACNLCLSGMRLVMADLSLVECKYTCTHAFDFLCVFPRFRLTLFWNCAALGHEGSQPAVQEAERR